MKFSPYLVGLGILLCGCSSKHQEHADSVESSESERTAAFQKEFESITGCRDNFVHDGKLILNRPAFFVGTWHDCGLPQCGVPVNAGCILMANGDVIDAASSPSVRFDMVIPPDPSWKVRQVWMAVYNPGSCVIMAIDKAHYDPTFSMEQHQPFIGKLLTFTKTWRGNTLYEISNKYPGWQNDRLLGLNYIDWDDDRLGKPILEKVSR